MGDPSAKVPTGNAQGLYGSALFEHLQGSGLLLLKLFSTERVIRSVMKDGMIPFPAPGRKGPLEIDIEIQKGSDRIEFLAYAIVGMSAVLAVALHLAASGTSRGMELEVVKMAGRLVEIIGLV